MLREGPTPHGHHHQGMCRSERADCKLTATAPSSCLAACDLASLQHSTATTFKIQLFRLNWTGNFFASLLTAGARVAHFCRWRSFNVQEKSTEMVSWETCCWPVSDLWESSEGYFVPSVLTLSLHCTQAAHKSFKVKRFLAKKASQNRPIPQWFRQRTNNKIRWEPKMFTAVGGTLPLALSWDKGM